jgi:hypothetical protein
VCVRQIYSCTHDVTSGVHLLTLMTFHDMHASKMRLRNVFFSFLTTCCPEGATETGRHASAATHNGVLDPYRPPGATNARAFNLENNETFLLLFRCLSCGPTSMGLC